MRKIMSGALLTALALVLVAGLDQAHAELTIWHVENSPSGIDSGNEWLTLINLGELDTLDGYDIKTTHGRITSYTVPTITLDTCEYHKITFSRQAIDNEDDTVKLRKNGTTIYETPVIKDTSNNYRFWTNPNVAATCDEPSKPAETTSEMTLEQRVQALEERADRTDITISALTDNIALLWTEIEIIADVIMTILESLDIVG